MSNFNGSQKENYFVHNKCKNLENLKRNIEEIKAIIKENIDIFNKNLESLEKEINIYIHFLEVNAQDYQDIIMKQKDFNEEIRKKIKIFFDSIINLFYSKNLNIIDSRKKIYNFFDEFINFDFSPKEESDIIINCSNFISNNDSNERSHNFSHSLISEFFNEIKGEEEQNSSRHNSNGARCPAICAPAALCSECHFNKSSISYLNKKYCEKCIIKVINKMFILGIFPNLDDIIYFDDQKELFMNSFEALIKIILLIFNYILNNESKFSNNIENHIKGNIFIELNYPTIMINKHEISDENSMKDINLFLDKGFNTDFRKSSEKNFNFINLNELIKGSLKKILNDDKRNIVENDYISEDEMIEFGNMNVNNE